MLSPAPDSARGPIYFRNDPASGSWPGKWIRALWLDGAGDRGWAFGDGAALRYDGKQWKPDDAASRASSYEISALWLDGAGDRGWAVGLQGVVLRYDGKQWKRDDIASRAGGGPWLRALWLDRNEERGWAVGDRGTVLRYDGKQWKRDNAASGASGFEALSALWLDGAGVRGWAAGQGGVVLGYDGKQWKRDDAASRASGGKWLTSLWLDGKGERGWAVGQDGVVLGYDGKQWKRDDAASGASGGKTLTVLWLDEKGEQGWAVGRARLFEQGSVVLGYDGKQWKRDDAASGASGGKWLDALWLDRKGERGWAVGEDGVFLALTLAPAGSVQVDSTIGNFSGHVKIHFLGLVPLKDSVKVAIKDSSGATLVPSESQFFSVLRESSEKDYVVVFNSKSEGIANRAKGQPFQLRISADFGDSSLPTEVTFVPESSLYVKGSYWLWPYLNGIVGLLCVNLALVLAAIYSPWARRLALDPNIRVILGVGLFKYVITEPLLVHVPAIRQALFRDYRRSLRKHPQLLWWKEHEYVPPRISSIGFMWESTPELPRSPSSVLAENADSPGSAADKSSKPDAVRSVLEFLIRKTYTRQQVWLVEGQSGLGKSAFLQQIARASLDGGLTPLLLPLGSGQSLEREVATLMSEYGDLKVSTTTAIDIVEGGGFVLLLDALNEDRQPDATLAFLRTARKRNITLLSSQFSPSWPPSVPVERIDLAPFGREQLEKILPEGWVDKVLEAPHLSEVAGLPVTAFLLRAYICKHACLPASDFAIYSSLSEGLIRSDTLNLEQRAWGLFKVNGQLFKADGRLTEEFCESAVRSNVLTRRSSRGEANYRFVHERVSRFFVASYLFRQDKLTLVDWHKELDPSFGRAYWTDVIEFLAAMNALSGLQIDQRTGAYSSFLREAAEFAPNVFAERLYPQYQRYRDAGELSRDAALEDWTARFLSDLVSGKRPRQN